MVQIFLIDIFDGLIIKDFFWGGQNILIKNPPSQNLVPQKKRPNDQIKKSWDDEDKSIESIQKSAVSGE